MKCARCGQDMLCYVSSRVGGHVKQRRLYFSCKCGMIAAHNEEQGPADDISQESTETR
jgi:hypothetical protein